MEVTMKKALLLVDIQNDFLPGGALAVTDGDAVVPVANRLISQFDLVIATQDWHPSDHGSFASLYPGKSPGEMVGLSGIDQILWPDHCVEGTTGAEFAPGLETSGITVIFKKGTDKSVDSYSAFFDNAKRKDTGLAAYLKSEDVDTLYLVGLATDYCVKFSALDAVELGFKTVLIKEGVRGVNITPGDSDAALKEMAVKGVSIISEDQI